MLGTVNNLLVTVQIKGACPTSAITQDTGIGGIIGFNEFAAEATQMALTFGGMGKRQLDIFLLLVSWVYAYPWLYPLVIKNRVQRNAKS